MKSATVLAIFTITVLAAPAYSQEVTTPTSKNRNRADESVQKVKELRRERIAVLEQLIEQLTALYKITRVSYEEVLEARVLLCEAKLEDAETDTERVALYQELVAVLRQHEEFAEGKWLAARGMKTNVLKAKAKRLEAEIHWEQAKMRITKTGP